MDGNRFDTLAKLLANGISRRVALRAVVTGTATAALGLLGPVRVAADARTCRDICSFFAGLAPGACRAACARCEGRGGEFCGVGFYDRPFCCPAGEVCLQQKSCCPREQVCRFSGSIVACCATGYRCVVNEAGEGNCQPA
jgi:hypothetical protein